MNPKIDPEIALKRVDAFLKEIENKKLLEKNYKEGSADLKRIIKEIEGLLKATFSDSKKRIKEYYPQYYTSSRMRIDYQDRYIKKVKIAINDLLSLKSELKLHIDSKSTQNNENNEEDQSKSPVTQHFHGNIGNFAFGDINNYDTTIYFNALIKAIEESKDIPPEEKEGLIDKIKDVANNPYVAGVGASVIFEGIKALSMGVKPF